MYYKLLMEWLQANDGERFRATTSYEQNTLRDFAMWLDERQVPFTEDGRQPSEILQSVLDASETMRKRLRKRKLSS